MIHLQFHLLRRTSAALAAAALTLFASDASALTVTLSSGVSCNYQNMTVQPNGNVSVTCEGPVTPPSQNGTFSVSGPTSNVNYGSAAVTATVSRAGGAEGAVAVNYTVASPSGACTPALGTLNWVDLDAAAKTISIPIGATIANVGQCTITIAVGTPGNSGITQVSFNVIDPANDVVCPTPPTNAVAASLAWGGLPTQLRLASGQIGYYPLSSHPEGKPTIKLTQGQQAALPSGLQNSILSISRCPGVIDTSVPGCFFSTSFANNSSVTAYTAPVQVSIYLWNSQATLGSRGCYAPPSTGPWYVNVRWMYTACTYQEGCGFSHQWTAGPY